MPCTMVDTVKLHMLIDIFMQLHKYKNFGNNDTKIYVVNNLRLTVL